MRTRITLLALCLTVLGCLPGFSQCPGCVIDPTCPSIAPDGGLCPDIVPDATVGEAYDEDITFYIPQEVEDPGTGLTVDVLQVTITAINGLPIGLDWECNNSASGCVYEPPLDPPNSELGCVKICGTPVGTPGTYNVTVDVIAQVVALGLTLTQPETYEATIELLPSTTGASTFSFSGEPDCFDNYVVDFSASIDGSPNITTYDWDFGNGNTSTDQNPPSQTYPEGIYTASLNTTIFDYQLNTVNLNSMNDNWCGDVEEINLFGLCVANPDPFFIVRDASSNVIYTSSTVNDVLSASWTGLTIAVPPTFSIEFIDEDLISGNDALGTFSFSLTDDGTFSFSGAGGTSGTIEVGTTVQTVFNDSTSIFAFANPFIGPSATITDVSTVGGMDGAIDIAIDGGTPPYNYFWSNGATTENISGLSAGDYVVTITDQNGCSISDTFSVIQPADVPCDPAPDNLVAVIFSSTEVLLDWDPIVQPDDGYQVWGRRVGDLGWVRRQNTTSSLFVEGLTPNTDYEWKVRAKCQVTGNISGFSASNFFTTPSLRETSMEQPLALMPNPSAGQIQVIFGSNAEQLVQIEVHDGLGRLVYQAEQSMLEGSNQFSLNLQHLASGMYTMSLTGSHGLSSQRLVIE